MDRPESLPPEGTIAPFDAGWDAHALGISRESVEVIAADPAWALMGYDARARCVELGVLDV